MSIFFAFGCAGSQGTKNTWRSVKNFHDTYINTPSKLKFDEKEYCEPYQLALSESISEVDYLLDQLMRAMDDSDRDPDEEWLKYMFRNFPWLAGIAITDGQGRSMFHVPEFSLKEFNIGPLLNEPENRRQTELRSYVMESPMGPEIYLAKPVYMQDELRALIVCHFDIRSLLAYAGKPENFVMLTGQTVLWTAVYDVSETPLSDADWPVLGKKGVDGLLRNEKGEFYWLAAYFADMQLVYSMPVKGEFSVNPSQLNVLKQADSFAAPKNLN